MTQVSKTQMKGVFQKTAAAHQLSKGIYIEISSDKPSLLIHLSRPSNPMPQDETWN